ncbi:MAG TPA: Na-translocating system protein MpsC family protein [Thermoleophilaceae bacterium]
MRLQSATSAITEMIVHLLRVKSGRGPTKASTSISSDLAIVTLGECVTTFERMLADQGQGDAAMRLRSALHEGIRAEAVAAVEEITGRHVVAYLAAQEHDPDVAIIAFYFERPARVNGHVSGTER